MKEQILHCVLAIAGIAGIASVPAHAEVVISGFGQVVAGRTVGDGKAFREKKYTDDLELREESLFAVQIDADITESTRAVGQIVARGYDNFNAELAWAYINFELENGWAAKVGRQRTPVFRYSDFLDVGYAYPWIRQPVWNYYMPWHNIDGVSVSHSAAAGKWYSRLQVLVGNYVGDVRQDGNIYQSRFEDVVSIGWEVDYDEWLSLRAAYMPARITFKGTNLDQLLPVLNNVGLGGLASKLAFDGDRATFANVGAKVERAGWVVVGEYTVIDIENSVFPRNKSWYLSAGYRVGEFVPYATFGRRDSTPRMQLLDLVPAGSPLRPIVAGAISTRHYDDAYYGVGIRWDLMPKVALKADWSRSTTEVPGRTDTTLVSAGVTFIF